MAVNCDKCGFKTSRAAIYVFNLMFWILGAAMIGLGIWLHVTNDSYLELAPGYRFLTPSVLFIAPGCLSILVGFLGCCGAITENRCMITSYCILAVLVVILEVSAGITAFVGEAQFDCCGVYGYKDWFKSHGWPDNDYVPDSCCRMEYPNCGTTGKMDTWFLRGCLKPISEFISSHLQTVAITTVSFAGVQVLAVVGALIFLYFHRRKS